MSFEETCDQVVEFLKNAIPLGFWSIAQYDGGRQVFVSVQDDAYGTTPGQSISWSDTFCQHMVTGAAPAIAPDAMAVPQYAQARVAQILRIGAYMSVPIRGADGSLFGTICALDPGVQPPELLEHAPVLRLVADLLGRVLESQQLRDEAKHRADELDRQAISLARSEALHRLVTENSSDLITRHAGDGQILYASRAAHPLLGVPDSELVGCHPFDLCHPDDLAILMDDDGNLRAAPGAGELAFRLRHRDGNWVWVEATQSILRESDGTLSEVQMCIRDITERRTRDADFHHESKLESLGRLSAGLAHEINTPIQYVGDNARFLEEAYRDLIGVVCVYRGLLDSANPIGWQERLVAMREAESGIDFEYLQKEIPSAVEQTLQGIDRVATIVRAMKTFSHPGHHEHTHADLNEALEATVTVTRHQVSEVADLCLDLGDLPPVRCNIADLNQVFLNLIINAADAIEEAGRRGTIGIRTAVDGDYAVVAISDTGTGIPEHVRSMIFEPFFTTKEVGRGSGQGLPLARGVIQEGHGGMLTVDSQSGAGSTFTVRIPIEGIRGQESAA